MKKKKQAEITIGMVLAQPVLGPQKVNLIVAGTILTAEHLGKLRKWDIDAVYIVDDEAPLSEDEQFEKKEEKTRKVFQKTYSKAVNCTKNILKNIVNNEPLQVEEVKSTVEEMIDKVVENRDVLMQLSWLNVMDNYLFTHSVNVCAYSLIVGVYLNLSQQQMLELGTTALLHDIGMAKLDQSVWNHGRSLTSTSWQEIKSHPALGAEILEKLGKYPKRIIEGVRQHHERGDGSGYPDQLKEDKINYYAAIVGLVNIYESLTGKRKYRQQLIPNEAMKIILVKGKNHFPAEVLRAFVSHMAIYPIGSNVLLNTSEIARVTGITSDHPFRPRLKVLYDSDHNPQTKVKLINLSSKKHEVVYICKCLSETEIKVLTGNK